LPILYAKAAGLFEKVGLDVKWLPVTSNSTQLAALVDSGQVDFAQAAASAPFTAQAVGKDIVTFAVISRGGFSQVILTNDAMARLKGVTPQSSAKEKVQALKGLKIALPVAGTTADLQFRAVLELHGVQPDKDLTLVPNSDLNAVLPSAKLGRVDGYVAGPPTSSLAVAQGWGTLWIDYTTEVPLFDEAPLGVMIAKRTTLTAKAEATRRVVQVVRQALQDIKEKPDVVAAAVKPKYYENVDQKTFDLAIKSSAPLFFHDMTVSQKGFDQSLKTLLVVDSGGKPVTLGLNQVFDFSVLNAN
jgi:NitT/TauT family transport system substrate-binding protein